MTSYSITVARAALTAAFLRPDPAAPAVPQEKIVELQGLVEAALGRCSSTNIETCKKWLLENAVQSSARIGAVGKYLVAIAKAAHVNVPARLPSQDSTATKKLSASRASLHALYLVGDVLHHTQFHLADNNKHTTTAQALLPHIGTLFSVVASEKRDKPRARARAKLLGMLEVWERGGLYSTAQLEELNRLASGNVAAGITNPGEDVEMEIDTPKGDQSSKLREEAPYIMPASHGDAAIPWHDLPAANMMPHIVPNRAISINTALLKPLKLKAGPVDSHLQDAVKNFLGDVERIYDTSIPVDETLVVDIDELGQLTLTDPKTGVKRREKSYYGWTPEFSEQMKNRKKFGVPFIPEPRHRSRSRGRSPHDDRRRGRSRSPIERKEQRSSFSRGQRSWRRSPSSGYDSARPRQPFREDRSEGPRSRQIAPDQARRASLTDESAVNKAALQGVASDHQSGSRAMQPLPFAPPLIAPNPGSAPSAPPTRQYGMNSQALMPPQMFPQNTAPMQQAYAHLLQQAQGIRNMLLAAPPPPPAGYQGPWPPPPPPPGMPPFPGMHSQPNTAMPMNMPMPVAGFQTGPTFAPAPTVAPPFAPQHNGDFAAAAQNPGHAGNRQGRPFQGGRGMGRGQRGRGRNQQW